MTVRTGRGLRHHPLIRIRMQGTPAAAMPLASLPAFAAARLLVGLASMRRRRTGVVRCLRRFTKPGLKFGDTLDQVRVRRQQLLHLRPQGEDQDIFLCVRQSARAYRIVMNSGSLSIRQFERPQCCWWRIQMNATRSNLEHSQPL